jgi:hypothetical protein
MHVDFITPDGSSKPVPLNLSAVPGGYFTQYQTEETSKDQSSNESTTKWSRGVAKQVGAKLVLGDPEVTGATAALDVGAQQTWESSTKTLNDSYTARTFNASQQTGFGDQVWFTESRFNLYIYPVLGQTACPDDGSPQPCPDNQKRPLYVQFSGPDPVHDKTAAGPGLEWYQPPWEPGNVVSYPASVRQLEMLYPDMHVLSKYQTWYTDASVLLQKTTLGSGYESKRHLGQPADL